MPGKNVKLLAGKPAIAYSIRAALDSELFDRVIVSTDSEAIAEISRAAGAETPFMRAPELSGDHTGVSEVTLDALERVDGDGTRYDAVCQLMANCPLRNAEDVRSSHSQFVATGANAQLSVTSYGWLNPWWAMRMDPDHRLEHILPDSLGKRSQDLPELFCPTGAVWWATSDALRKERTFHTSDKQGWQMPWYRAIDIDSDDDWRMAEMMLGLAGRLQTAK